MRELEKQLNNYVDSVITLLNDDLDASSSRFDTYHARLKTKLAIELSTQDKDGNTLLHHVFLKLGDKKLEPRERNSILRIYDMLNELGANIFIPNKQGITPYCCLLDIYQSSNTNAFLGLPEEWPHPHSVIPCEELNTMNALIVKNNQDEIAGWIATLPTNISLKAFLDKPIYHHATRGEISPRMILASAGRFDILSWLITASKLQISKTVRVSDIIAGKDKDVSIHRGSLLTAWGLTKTSFQLIGVEKHKTIASELAKLDGMDALVSPSEGQTLAKTRDKCNKLLLDFLKTIETWLDKKSETDNAKLILYRRSSCHFWRKPESARLICTTLEAFPERHKERCLGITGKLNQAQVLALNKLANYSGVWKDFSPFQEKKTNKPGVKSA